MKGLLLLLILVSAVQGAMSQPEPKPDLVDEFPATLCSDDIKFRLDIFLARISEHPDSVGFIVITPDRTMPGRALKYRQVIATYIRFRGFYPDRVRYSERPYGNSQIQFWLIPEGARFDEATFAPAPISETTLFDASEILIDHSGQLDFGGNWADEPCDFGLLFDQFASVFKANKELVAHLLFSSGGNIGRRKANAALRIAVKRLSKDLGIAADRIKTKYVGRRKLAELQLWIVPKGGVPPVFRDMAVPTAASGRLTG